MWFALWRAIIWSRDTPYVTACMIGHCTVVSFQRRSVSARGSVTTFARLGSRYVTAKARIQKALQALIAAMPIGGTLTSGQIILAIMGADPGVVDVTLESGDTDYALSANQVAVLGLSLTETPGAGLLCLTKVP